MSCVLYNRLGHGVGDLDVVEDLLLTTSAIGQSQTAPHVLGGGYSSKTSWTSVRSARRSDISRF